MLNIFELIYAALESI